MKDRHIEKAITDERINQIAQVVARRLLHYVDDKHATRLVMEFASGPKLNGPGWGRSGIVFAVEAAIREAAR